ncbi:MAG TPA: peptide chain release factor N(5)-glutamine methyltransferase [Solirubrobacteraceae bacterium]|nr:peptide chain release factor N(5)-glutamine methyltransferase [Solirubrobacteraceae bacterium]
MSGGAGTGPGAARERSALRGVPVRDALDSALVALEAAGVDTPRLDAEVLLARALGVDRAALAMHPDREVAGPAARWFQDAVRRRALRREPVAYIVGRKGFRHIELEVDARVLVPRPETELLVEAALELHDGARVVDVGTGSGAVALALKDERPDLRVTGTDVSADARAVARANGERLGLEVEWRREDLFSGDFDAVLSNPPYVEDGASLPPELAHEPREALFAGADGLDVVRRLIERASGVGTLALEVGAGQADAVAALARAAGFATVAKRADLAGIERVVVARR